MHNFSCTVFAHPFLDASTCTPEQRKPFLSIAEQQVLTALEREGAFLKAQLLLCGPQLKLFTLSTCSPPQQCLLHFKCSICSFVFWDLFKLISAQPTAGPCCVYAERAESGKLHTQTLQVGGESSE